MFFGTKGVNMNGAQTASNLNSASLGGQIRKQKVLNVGQLDNGYTILDSFNYNSPLQKVALDFDSMVAILKEYFEQSQN